MRRSRRLGMTGVQFLGTLGVVLVGAFGFYYWANNKAESGKRTVSIQRMTDISAALEKYCVDCGGTLPTPKQGLEALITPPTRSPRPSQWNGPYLATADELRDGWNRPFKYLCPGGPMTRGSSIMRAYDLASYGRDGSEGGRGLDRDLYSWDRSSLAP
jgi:general secretion pathway protein G